MALMALTASRMAVLGDMSPVTDMATYNSGAFGVTPNQTFRSINAVAPVFGINTWNARKLADNSLPLLFLTLSEPDSTSAPYIFNATDLSLIWAGSGGNYPSSNNFRPQIYNNQQYLTFWEGDQSKGYGNGACLLLDSSYQQAYSVTTKNLPVGADLHECELTDDGTALISAYGTIPYDLRSVGGAQDGTLLDSYFQEIDIATGNLVFSWTASQWFTPDDSYMDYSESEPFDFFHINSISKVRKCPLQALLYLTRI